MGELSSDIAPGPILIFNICFVPFIGLDLGWFHYFVSLGLLIITDQCNIKEVLWFHSVLGCWHWPLGNRHLGNREGGLGSHNRGRVSGFEGLGYSTCEQLGSASGEEGCGP